MNERDKERSERGRLWIREGGREEDGGRGENWGEMKLDKRREKSEKFLTKRGRGWTKKGKEEEVRESGEKKKKG